MDPIANLEEQRRLARTILETPERDIAGTELAELVEALDDWRLRGGFDPYAAAETIGARRRALLASLHERLAGTPGVHELVELQELDR